MGVREIWNAMEAVLVAKGFQMADPDEVPQGKRYTMQVVEVPSEQPLRGSIGNGKVRMAFGFEVRLVYEMKNDRRLERRMAEDAEDMIVAIYHDVNLSNHRFQGATIERDALRGLAATVIRFDFQTEAVV